MWSLRALGIIGKKSAVFTCISCLILTLPMCTSLPDVRDSFSANAAMATTSQFSDLSNKHWAQGSVKNLCQKGIIAGYPDGTFKPGNTVTYGEYIKMVVEADSNDPVYFVDISTPETESEAVENANWAEGYYETALAKNYFNANRINKKMLRYPIPRRDMALISSSVLGTVKIENYDEIQAAIKDINSRTRDEYEITKAYAMGVLNGYPDMTFKPDNTLTRAEAAVSIERLLLAIEEKQKAEEAVTSESISVPKPNTDIQLELIDDLITNRSDIPIMSDVKYYWMADNNPYEFEKIRSLLGTEAIKILPEDPARVVVFIVGDKAYRTSDLGSYIYWPSGAEDGSNLPYYDYIGFYSRCNDTMMLIPNSLKFRR